MDSDSFCRNKLSSRRSNRSRPDLCALAVILFVCIGLEGCGSASSSSSHPKKGSAPVIASFAADPATINSGTGSTLNWAATGATRIAIAPGKFTSTSASGSTGVSPTATTAYTLTATNAAGSTTSTATVTVNAVSKPRSETMASSWLTTETAGVSSAHPTLVGTIPILRVLPVSPYRISSQSTYQASWSVMTVGLPAIRQTSQAAHGSCLYLLPRQLLCI